MRIVNFSITPLAGGPYRLLSVLRRETRHDVRLIDLKRWGRYPQDVIFEEAPDEAMEVVRGADVIHLHNYIDLETEVFRPIDFPALQREGKAILRQFRTAPGTLSGKVNRTVEEIVTSEVPSIVIAQFHERYYPRALVVPNAVPSQQPEYACVEVPADYDICYSPSGMTQAWSSRWDTKGGPETTAMLQEVQKVSGARTIIISGKPLSEVLEKKRRSRIVLDDLVTGSYHASGLEGLCLGKAVLCHLDERTLKVLAEVAGTQQNPFVNARLEDAGEVLVGLMRDPSLVQAMGREGRAWIDRYWSEREIAQRYCGVYEQLLKDPTQVRRQEALRVDGAVRTYVAVTLSDLVYRGRGKRYRQQLSLGGKIGRAARRGATSTKKKILARLPASWVNFYRGKRRAES